MLLENESYCLKMVWAYGVLSFRNWGFDYLMNIDEEFLFVKSFDIVYILELIENGLCLFWDGLKGVECNSTKFWNSTNFVSNDHHLHPMTSFESSNQF